MWSPCKRNIEGWRLANKSVHHQFVQKNTVSNYAAQHKRLKVDAHPVHAVVVSDLQLLLCLLEAGMFVVISGGFKVDIHIVGWHCKQRVRISGGAENCDPGMQRTGRERNLHACIIKNLAD